MCFRKIPFWFLKHFFEKQLFLDFRKLRQTSSRRNLRYLSQLLVILTRCSPTWWIHHKTNNTFMLEPYTFAVFFLLIRAFLSMSGFRTNSEIRYCIFWSMIVHWKGGWDFKKNNWFLHNLYGFVVFFAMYSERSVSWIVKVSETLIANLCVTEILNWYPPTSDFLYIRMVK